MIRKKKESTVMGCSWDEETELEPVKDGFTQQLQETDDNLNQHGWMSDRSTPVQVPCGPHRASVGGWFDDRCSDITPGMGRQKRMSVGGWLHDTSETNTNDVRSQSQTPEELDCDLDNSQSKINTPTTEITDNQKNDSLQEIGRAHV